MTHFPVLDRDDVVRAIRPGERAAAAAVLADAFMDFPATRAFAGTGAGATESTRRFMQASLSTPAEQLTVLVAEVGSRIVGVLTCADRPACLAVSGLKARTFLRIAGSRLPRLARWGLAIMRMHPRTPHRHLQMIGVARDCWGTGVGGRLLAEFARQCDEAGLAGYLETIRWDDPAKPSPERLYRRHGFEVLHEARVADGFTLIGMARAAPGAPRPAPAARPGRSTSGYLPTGHAFDRIGTGPRQVVVLQGLTLDNRPMGRLARTMLGAYHPLEAECTITLVNRRAGPPVASTMAGIAADTAAMIRATFDGPVDLVGTSTGGSIALQVAIDHPDVVRRLVVHSAAYTLGPEGRRLQRLAADLARRGDWRGVGRLMAGWVRPARGPARALFPLVVPLTARVLASGHPADPTDFVSVIEAEDAFDCRAGLQRISAPTLVIAGAEDPGYGPDLFRETAAGIPGARLILYEGMGHPARGPRFREDLVRFLGGTGPPAGAESGRQDHGGSETSGDSRRSARTQSPPEPASSSPARGAIGAPLGTLAITSITNFVLAGELFFLAGLMVRTPKARFSAAWFWAGAMFALACSALIGGIDHGFVEPAGMPRYLVQRPNWIVVGVATFCMLLATARQFLAPRWQQPVLVLAAVQLAAYALGVLLVDDFRLVIVNYVPVMLFLLLMSVLGLRNGTGSWQMVAGILVLLTASAVQALDVDVLTPLDQNGLYHLISMVGVLFMYWGGQRLKVT
ncbi:MAG: putative hydrolase [Chloroflexi bacterium]|nr:putative hydrolase [Chloroflexota bacterium]